MTSSSRNWAGRCLTASTISRPMPDGSAWTWTMTRRPSPCRPSAAGGDVGAARYTDARHLTITADGGGSNASRSRLWKREPQGLANEFGIEINVHHLPPGTSKWNKIEHRLFSFIRMNWRAKPLVSYRVIVDLIGATTTETGLAVRCELDTGRYPKGIAVTESRDGRDRYPPCRLPRRVELHHHTERTPLRSSS